MYLFLSYRINYKTKFAMIYSIGANGRYMARITCICLLSIGRGFTKSR